MASGVTQLISPSSLSAMAAAEHGAVVAGLLTGFSMMFDIIILSMTSSLARLFNFAGEVAGRFI